MLNTRFSAAGAAALLVLGLAAGSAAAQTATDETPGKPLQLLKIVEQPNRLKSKLHRHPKTAAVKGPRTHIAKLEHKRPHAHGPVQTAAAPTPAGALPAPNSTAPMSFAAAEPAPAPQLAPTPSAPFPSELVVGGQTVQVASPNAVNDIDLAANDKDAQGTAATPSGATASLAAAGSAAASTVSASDGAEPTAKSDSMNAAAAEPPVNPVGSTSWLLQVFAALGGAVAAGSVAWFLIGSAPQRTYG